MRIFQKWEKKVMNFYCSITSAKIINYTVKLSLSFPNHLLRLIKLVNLLNKEKKHLISGFFISDIFCVKPVKMYII